MGLADRIKPSIQDWAMRLMNDMRSATISQADGEVLPDTPGVHGILRGDGFDVIEESLVDGKPREDATVRIELPFEMA